MRISDGKESSQPRCLGCAGHDALHALQKGATLRKKWVSSTSAADAAQVPKTERLIRCRIEGSKVVLHYYHQVRPCAASSGGGFSGLYRK